MSLLEEELVRRLKISGRPEQGREAGGVRPGLQPVGERAAGLRQHVEHLLHLQGGQHVPQCQCRTCRDITSITMLIVLFLPSAHAALYVTLRA